MRTCRTLALMLVLLGAGSARAELLVAVASNFARPAQELATLFAEQDPQVRIRLSSASSGKHYAQIRNGAPFDVFLSADRERPERLEQEGFAVSGSRFTYAYGRLALWSASPRLADRDCRQALMDGDFRRLAIANPRVAPYGAAAVAVLQGLGLANLGDRVVHAENIAQVLQFVSTGNAELGFVARAQLRDPGLPPRACEWVVPADRHPPIAQQAVLLARGAANPSAVGFLRFLQGETARRLIVARGYDVDP